MVLKRADSSLRTLPFAQIKLLESVRFCLLHGFVSFCFCRLSFVYELLHCFKCKCRTGILQANLCRFRKPEGSSFLLEIKLGGHCSFTSCELYNPAYGNGIGESKSLTKPNETYQALDISRQHEIINRYGLAFLNKYLKGMDDSLLKENRFEEHVLYRT